MAGPPARGLLLHAFLALELVLATLGVAGVLIEAAGPVAARCTGPGDATFLYVSVVSAVSAVPLGLAVLLALAAVWVRTEGPVPRLKGETAVSLVATSLGVLAVLGWFGVCGEVGPFAVA